MGGTTLACIKSTTPPSKVYKWRARLVTSLVGEGQLRGNYGSSDRGEAPTPEAGRGLGDQGNFLSSRGKVLLNEHKL